VVLLAAWCKTLRFMDGASLEMRFKPCTLFAPSATRAQNCTFVPSLHFLFSLQEFIFYIAKKN
jgi:hypothetical protein